MAPCVIKCDSVGEGLPSFSYPFLGAGEMTQQLVSYPIPSPSVTGFTLPFQQGKFSVLKHTVVSEEACWERNKRAKSPQAFSRLQVSLEQLVEGSCLECQPIPVGNQTQHPTLKLNMA